MGCVCSFFGHRNFEVNDEIERKLLNLIEDLIVNYNVETFLFGSKSGFDTLCHKIVYNLKSKYTHIKTVVYICPSEGYILNTEKEKYEKLYSSYYIVPYDEVFKHKNWLKGRRASYIERNFSMIDDSQFCIFYYNQNYVVEQRKPNKKHLTYIQPNSGTKLAYDYAKRKHKTIYNTFLN